MELQLAAGRNGPVAAVRSNWYKAAAMNKPDSETTDVDRTQFIQREPVDDPSSDGRSGCVTIIHGQGHDLGKHRVLRQELVIGREEGCGFVIDDFGASRQHCRVYEDGAERYYIDDLGSTNGTEVEGTRVEQPLLLRDGDKIFIGDTVLRFRLYDALDLKFASEVTHLIGTDPLTGLQAKRTFDHALEYAIAETVRAGRPLSLMMMDLDGVKQINDTHGHLFGAFSIQQAGKIIQQVLGRKGRASRFGGDEFTAFLPDVEKDAAVEIAEGIRVTFENAGLEKDGIPLKPTISIGVATLPGNGQELLPLIDAADRALYRAKREGGNRVCPA
jgi:diguanylate cyclase (GGDEF)-like protein